MILEYYEHFSTVCQYFDLPPKYVLFSIVSALGATVLSLGAKGTLNLAWLTTKLAWRTTVATIRWTFPKPNDLGKMVLASLEKANYVHDEKIPALIASGCTAGFKVGDTNPTVSVDKQFVTDDLDSVTMKRIKKLFDKHRDIYEENQAHLKAETDARRITALKKSLARANQGEEWLP